VSVDRLYINYILTQTYGHPTFIEFVFTPMKPNGPGIVGKDFTGRSWLAVHQKLLDIWHKYAGQGYVYMHSVADPPQFAAKRFYKGSLADSAPLVDEFFAELMVKNPEEISVPTTEGWEDLI